MNTEKNYGFRVIDTKLKEAYFNVRPINEEATNSDSYYRVWSMMNVIAVNNICIQQRKAS